MKLHYTMPLLCILIITCDNQPTTATQSWQFIGNEIVSIDNIELNSDTVTNDTLIAQIYSSSIRSLQIPGDKFENDTILMEWNDNSVTITLTADLYKWTGTGDMPPTSPSPRCGEQQLIPLKNKKGQIQIDFTQSDGAFESDTVYSK